MLKFKKPKIAIFSDLHLGVRTNSDTWHTRAIEWATWFRNELRQKNIKDIVFCGDWHHNRSEIAVNTLQASADILDILSEFNMVCITGNHDLFYKHRTDVSSLSIYKNRKNLHVFDTIETVEAFDRVISFCPWNTLVKDIPKSDVIFGHFEVETFKMNSYKVCDEGIKVKDLLNKSSIIISGHFHTRHEKKYTKGNIIYVGNPFEMDFGDINNSKGYYILDLDTLDYDFYENPISPKHVKLHLSEFAQESNITPRIVNLVSNNIVKFKIDLNINQDDLEFLLNHLSNLKPEELTVDYDINFNRIIDDFENREDLSSIDIAQAIREFINMLDVNNKPQIIDYTLDLYEKCKF